MAADKRNKASINKKKKSRNNKKRGGTRTPKNKKLRTKISILVYSLLIAFAFVFLLSRYANTTSLQMKVAEKTNEIEELKEKQDILSLQLEEIKDSGEIEEQARIRINLRKAKKDQIIYLDLK